MAYADTFPTGPRISIACAFHELARFGVLAYNRGRTLIDARNGQEIIRADRFGDVDGDELRQWLGFL